MYNRRCNQISSDKLLDFSHIPENREDMSDDLHAPEIRSKKFQWKDISNKKLVFVKVAEETESSMSSPLKRPKGKSLNIQKLQAIELEEAKEKPEDKEDSSSGASESCSIDEDISVSNSESSITLSSESSRKNTSRSNKAGDEDLSVSLTTNNALKKFSILE